MNIIEQIKTRIGIDITQEQSRLLLNYIDAIYEENKLYNLTGCKTKEDMFENLVIDSLFIFNVETARRAVSMVDTKLLDIGAGAGIPGIPIKIINNDINISMIESSQKKSKFMSSFITANKLEGIVVINERAEILAREKKYRQAFDVVTAKALAVLGKSVEYAEPFLKTGGLFIAYKGKKFEDELKDAGKCIEKLGFELKEVMPVENTEKKLAVFEKKEGK